jgi:hypothetical protein
MMRISIPGIVALVISRRIVFVDFLSALLELRFQVIQWSGVNPVARLLLSDETILLPESELPRLYNVSSSMSVVLSPIIRERLYTDIGLL